MYTDQEGVTEAKPEDLRSKNTDSAVITESEGEKKTSGSSQARDIEWDIDKCEEGVLTQMSEERSWPQARSSRFHSTAVKGDRSRSDYQ